MKCLDCEYARKTKIKDHVCCGLFTALKHGFKGLPLPFKVRQSLSEQKSEKIFFGDDDYAKFYSDNLVLDSMSGQYDIGTGWADVKSRPKSEQSSGIITNFCIIVNENDFCSDFLDRK